MGQMSAPPCVRVDLPHPRGGVLANTTPDDTEGRADMRHGFRFGIQWASESTPRRWTAMLICALALIALALLIVPWNSIFPPPSAPVPVAHIQPAPSPSPSQVVQVIQVNGSKGAVCVVPTSRVRRPVELVRVP
jgi:hypothetical protein